MLRQFALFAETILGRPDLPADPKFNSNKARVANRQDLVDLISETLQKEGRDFWIQKLTGLGCVKGIRPTLRRSTHRYPVCRSAPSITSSKPSPTLKWPPVR